IGSLALSSAMFCDVIGISLTAITFAVLEAQNAGVFNSIMAVLSAIALPVAIVYTCRPAVLWMVRRTPVGKPVVEVFIFTIFVLVLITGFLGELIGQHYLYGPLVLGLVVPDGPPLGAAISSKLDTLASGLLYPTFLAVLFSSCTVKIGAVMLPALYFNMPVKEAFVLGLILNAKGVIELTVYKLVKEAKGLTEPEVSLCVFSVVILLMPLIKHLYNPTRHYLAIKRNTIQHSKRDQELRFLMCIHNHDSIPTIINLLEVSHASKENPVTLIAMFLVELVGRTSPILISHQCKKTLEKTASISGANINAFRPYEIHNQGYATVKSFTSVSRWETMHHDILRLAIDKQVTMILLPFHKQWAIDGSVGYFNRAIQSMNLNVFEKAPCSVGILIDR
ncbi:LOW QUALITY PROTEIN: Na_H_Exchanger domain-containing protein, partial [Cephalotus follicularis]